jgi:hypothetical protein
MTDRSPDGTGRTNEAAPLSLVPAPSSLSAREAEVFFNRAELDAILSVYGRKVAEGEWRDYAMGGSKDVAVFAVFRRTSEIPLYRIEKRPKLARRQGAYSVIAASGQILKRGHELSQVLRIFEKRKLRLVDD